MDCPRSGKPKPSVRDRLVRRTPITNQPAPSNQQNLPRLRARRPPQHPKSIDRCIREHLVWYRDRVVCNLVFWRRIHWSGQCRMLLRVTEFVFGGYVQASIQGVVKSVTIWRCFIWIETGSDNRARNSQNKGCSGVSSARGHSDSTMASLQSGSQPYWTHGDSWTYNSFLKSTNSNLKLLYIRNGRKEMFYLTMHIVFTVIWCRTYDKGPLT